MALVYGDAVDVGRAMARLPTDGWRIAGIGQHIEDLPRALRAGMAYQGVQGVAPLGELLLVNGCLIDCLYETVHGHLRAVFSSLCLPKRIF